MVILGLIPDLKGPTIVRRSREHECPHCGVEVGEDPHEPAPNFAECGDCKGDTCHACLVQCEGCGKKLAPCCSGLIQYGEEEIILCPTCAAECPNCGAIAKWTNEKDDATGEIRSGCPSCQGRRQDDIPTYLIVTEGVNRDVWF